VKHDGAGRYIYRPKTKAALTVVQAAFNKTASGMVRLNGRVCGWWRCSCVVDVEAFVLFFQHVFAL
jgi:hypothetical protein